MANIVDPVEMLLKTTSLLVPTTSSSSLSATPLPTIVPNPPIYETAGPAGKRTLWVVFIIMIVFSIIFTGMSWTVPVSKRLYHVLTTLITLIASCAYFAMASGAGVSLHHIHTTTEHIGGGETHQDVFREVYFARYIDWSLTTPLLLIDLLLLAGANGATIVMAVVADIFMIVTGLFAAYNYSALQKWGWYTIACVAYLVIVWHLVLNGRAAAVSKGSKVATFFTSIAGFTLVLWTAYPIVWGLADGSRRVGLDGEIIAYAVLDVLAKAVFGFWLLFTHSKMPETSVELGGFWSEGLGGQGRIRIGDDDEGA